MLGPLDIRLELLGAEVPHELVRLPRRLASAEELPEVLGVPARSCVVVRVYETDRGRRAVLLPAGSVPDASRLARALRARVFGLASPTATSVCTDFVASLVAPVCLPRDLPVLADASLGLEPVLYAATGDGGTVLKIESAELLRHTRAQVDTLTVPVVAHLIEQAVPHAGIAAVR